MFPSETLMKNKKEKKPAPYSVPENESSEELLQKAPARGYFRIDKGRLEEEWSEHGDNFSEVASWLAKAKRNAAKAKAALELVDAELFMAVTSSPESFDLEKSTEHLVKA